MLGGRIQEARKRRRWTLDDLAERVGATRGTMRRVERGDPAVSIGLVFEAATLVGVPLFHADEAVVAREAARLRETLDLLPERVTRLPEVDDDF